MNVLVNFFKKNKMKTLLIAGMLMMGLLFTQDACAQDYGRHFSSKSPIKIYRKSETIKVLDLGNVVKNSLRQVQSCAEQTIGGIEIILRAPFTPHPKRLPVLKEYRYYRPLYIPRQWERIN